VENESSSKTSSSSAENLPAEVQSKNAAWGHGMMEYSDDFASIR
jgi:hypothetical protein